MWWVKVNDCQVLQYDTFDLAVKGIPVALEVYWRHFSDPDETLREVCIKLAP